MGHGSRMDSCRSSPELSNAFSLFHFQFIHLYSTPTRVQMTENSEPAVLPLRNLLETFTFLIGKAHLSVNPPPPINNLIN